MGSIFWLEMIPLQCASNMIDVLGGSIVGERS